MIGQWVETEVPVKFFLRIFTIAVRAYFRLCQVKKSAEQDKRKGPEGARNRRKVDVKIL